MALIEWSPELEVGVPVVDEQHRGLVVLINRLHEINVGERPLAEMDGIFTELVAYTKTHFSTEEALMRRYGFARSAEHQAEHRKFVKVLSEFRAKYEGGQSAVSVVVLNFLRGWLGNHILESDKQLVRALTDLGMR